MGFHVKIDQFEEKIREYEAYPMETGKVLLYGSSFFANWGYADAREQWSRFSGGKLEVVNHGFGGASVDELLYYYHRMVLPYKPSAIVFRTGINDIFHGLTPGETWFLTERLVEWVRADFPEIPLIFLNIFDTTCPNAAQMSEMRRYNGMMAQYAREHSRMFYLDIDPYLHDDPRYAGTLEHFLDIFLPDGLHLTKEGYTHVVQYMAPKVWNWISQ